MFRGSIQRLVVAGFAAASLTVFAAPAVYAAPAEQSPAQANQQGWCEIVPTFCGKQCGQSARCGPVPCATSVTVDRARNEQADRVANHD